MIWMLPSSSNLDVWVLQKGGRTKDRVSHLREVSLNDCQAQNNIDGHVTPLLVVVVA